ncbi:MAG: PAS domain-containing protein [Planctomycetes bacterium]|nr:PAS domain-containing protein [Planctomycetota bacterium]
MFPDRTDTSTDARLRMALTAARMGIWEWDVGGDHVYWSPEVEALFGSPPGAFPPTFAAFLELVHPDDRDDLQRCVKNALRGSSDRFALDHRATRPDGSRIWLHCTGVVRRADDGVPERMIGTVADITEQKSLEAQLREAQKMEGLGRLAGGIAHDFNNLLTIVLGEIELLQFESELAPHVDASLHNVVDAAHRGQLLTRQLLTFARQRALQEDSKDAGETLHHLKPMLRRLAGSGINTEIVIEEGLGEVLVTHAQIEQVLMNLVLNAKEAMPRGGKLTLLAEALEIDEQDLDAPAAGLGRGVPAGTWLHVTVADTGPGIDETVLNHIFEPFFTTKPEGTGLGLSTCYGIVDQCGGVIWADTRPGGGTVFHVLVPHVKRLPRTNQVRKPSESGAAQSAQSED